jgi:hypothetical protein
MAKQTALTDRLNALASLRNAQLTDGARKLVRDALADKNNLIVAAAAKTAKKLLMREAAPLLVSAYSRFAANPLKTDRMCHAKLAIVDALDDIEHPDPDLFLEAVSYIQMEPTYGGPVDTAAKMRVRSGQALARMGYRKIFFVLAALLADKEPEVRFGAARILSSLGDERSELLLRMRILAGDPRLENYSEYFAALLSLNAPGSLPLVKGYLGDREQVIAEEAALALGESRLPEAFGLLADLFALTVSAERKRVLIVAISLLRSDDAAAFLIDIVKDQTVDLAGQAIDALRLYRDRPAIMDTLRLIVERRADRRLADKLSEMTKE